VIFFNKTYNCLMDERITDVYTMLWNTSFTAVSQGDIEIDPYITNPGSDRRRGMTLVFRPTEDMKSTILGFLDELKIIEPDQYFYQSSNLHFTVLSLFTAIANYQFEYDRQPAYQTAVENAIMDAQAFSMHLCGLTVSRSAMMICGFPDSDTLNGIRDTLRRNLNQSGLGQGLDIRYTLVAAHTTVIRFSHPLHNPAAFSQFLLENKQRDFGSFKVTELQLVKNDWYMSQEHTPIIARYALPGD
jgi:2'-5' RNA ligase